MTHPLSGDIFKSDADALVNPVNCVGVMGAGLARSFRERYPKNYKAYVKACERKELEAGTILPFYEKGKWIINFPTKIHWRNSSSLSAISAGLIATFQFVMTNYEPRIHSIAIPQLGCGLGGLDWVDVKPMILDTFEETNIIVELFE